jgi:hypothetical protein
MLEPLHEAVINILKVFRACLKLGGNGEDSCQNQGRNTRSKDGTASSFREKNSSGDCWIAFLAVG